MRKTTKAKKQDQQERNLEEQEQREQEQEQKDKKSNKKKKTKSKGHEAMKTLAYWAANEGLILEYGNRLGSAFKTPAAIQLLLPLQRPPVRILVEVDLNVGLKLSC